MKIIILGHTVSYEESANRGIYYLTRLIDQKEAKVFFDQAFSKGLAFFEDQTGINYKLSLSGAEYRLEKA